MKSTKDVKSLQKALYEGSSIDREEILESLLEIGTKEAIKIIIEFMNKPISVITAIGESGDSFDRYFYDSLTAAHLGDILISRGCEVVPTLAEIYWEKTTNSKTRRFIENILKYADIPRNPVSEWIVP